MASYHGNTHSDAAKMEQIITEFFTKSLHIILESRCSYVSSRNYSGEQVLSSPSPSSSSSSSSSFRPRDKWFNLALRDCSAALENIDFWRQSNLEPMTVDVILMQRPMNDEFGCEKIIERWVLQYESRKSKKSSCTTGALYKKSILLLRSLYSTVRLLPAYKLFRDLTSSGKFFMYNLGHRVSSFVEPFTHREELDMNRFVFTPIDTSCGRLCLSVSYRSSLLDISLEPSTPISPQFIPEYVGSPMAEPLKRFPSGISHSPNSSPFGRRHSWSQDRYRASPPNLSPSPTYSESRALLLKHRLPPSGVPHMKNPSYDDYWPSPVISPSLSPSPPTYVANCRISKALLRCESAPVSIPASRLSSMPNKLLLPPSPTTKATIPKQVAPHQTADKLFCEPHKISGMKLSSNSSASKSFSSRVSFQDDFDDSEFSGPFVVDDDDMVDPGSRLGLHDLPHELEGVKKSSQDAAVGALVRMLKKAPPLHNDIFLSKTREISQEQQSVISSKTTADALEELHGYKRIKDSLLNRTRIL